MKCLKTFKTKFFLALIAGIILTYPIWTEKLEEYLLISAINDSPSYLKEIKEDNMLVIGGVKGENLPQTGLEFYTGSLKENRALTQEELYCLTSGYGLYSAMVVDGHLKIICHIGEKLLRIQ